MNRLSTSGPFELTFSPNTTGSWATHQKDLKQQRDLKSLKFKDLKLNFISIKTVTFLIKHFLLNELKECIKRILIILISTFLIKINLPELVLPATMPNNSATATTPLTGSGIFKGKLHPPYIPSAAPPSYLATSVSEQSAWGN